MKRISFVKLFRDILPLSDGCTRYSVSINSATPWARRPCIHVRVEQENALSIETPSGKDGMVIRIDAIAHHGGFQGSDSQIIKECVLKLQQLTGYGVVAKPNVFLLLDYLATLEQHAFANNQHIGKVITLPEKSSSLWWNR